MKHKSLITSVFLALFLIFGINANANSKGNEKSEIKELTEATFDATIAKGIVIVDFWASWCRPCLMQAPIFEKAAKEMNGKVTFCKLDVDKAKNLANKLRIQGIPCLIIYKNGKEVERLVGVKPKDTIINALNNAINHK